MSSWGKKLDKKLATLTDNASRETIQTVANWIVFNRKHAAIITETLIKNLQEAKENAKRQWLYWQLIHEILIADRETQAKWDKLIELRVALGEGMIPVMEQLGNDMPSSDLNDFLKEWESLDAFGGPSLMSQIKRLYINRGIINDSVTQDAPAGGLAETPAEEGSASETSVPIKPEEEIHVTEIVSSAEAPTETIAIKSENFTEDMGSSNVKVEESPSKRRSSFSQNNKLVDYDFDASGVEPGKVEAKEFLEPCKAIATLQIARDVRANTALEISTGITNLPEDIVQTCKDLQSGAMKELDTAKINDYSVRIPSSLLDLNMEEELNSVQTYQDILQRQKRAREELIKLLLKSRCEFGSQAAAKDYYATATISEKLRKRKQLLSDALELEGLDTSQLVDDKDDDKKKKKESMKDDLPSIEWYNPEEEEASSGTEAETKKQRTS
ncbi:hypothetical protein IV203_010076 [Nitzschia inconspicua]|uniref:CID domain-containing protein n=1 Tax=Nitzschia inconspicua TaxID=303405 RepID=A0A9K3KWW9_9STRA|nr:hypothetical protein IV203_010076 [Nitzschia inconspicua]